MTKKKQPISDRVTSESDLFRQLFLFNTNKHKYRGVKPCIGIVGISYIILYRTHIAFQTPHLVYFLRYLLSNIIFKFVTKILYETCNPHT